MEPVRDTVALPDAVVSYLEWLPPSAPRGTVLLLHGGGLDSAWLSWGGIGAELAVAGYRVVAPDHPGWGRSPAAPWPATHDHLVAHTARLAGALELDRYVVGGLSMGGAVTLGLALEHPGRVAGVVLLGTFGLMDRQSRGLWTHPWHLLAWAMTHTGLMRATIRGWSRSRRLLEAGLADLVRNPDQRTPELVEEVLAEGARGAGSLAFDQWQRDQIRWGGLRTNYLDRLGEVTRPALVVHGDRDTGVPVELARRAAATLPDARLVEVAGAGHWVQRDRPEVVVPAVLDFLDRVR